MNLWKRVRSIWGGEAKSAPPRRVPPVSMMPVSMMAEEAPEIVVPELSSAQLQAVLLEDEPPLVIDIREPYEWRLVRMPGARHLPMNDVPAQLETLPRDRAVVVLCAHGSRSYSVAAWLIEQGIEASSLAGGISQWASQGGVVEQGAPVE